MLPEWRSPTAPERFAAELAFGALRIRTLGDILATYGQRPEHKSLAPDGSPAGADTTGLLQRRAVRSSPARTQLTEYVRRQRELCGPWGSGRAKARAQ